MIKTNVFEHVWIFDSNKQLIIKDGSSIEEVRVNNIWEEKFYIKEYIPYVLIKSKISYHGQHTGTLFVAYKVPLGKSFTILALITLMFLLFSYYLKIRILSMGENIAKPVTAFMNNLEDSLRAINLLIRKKEDHLKSLLNLNHGSETFLYKQKNQTKLLKRHWPMHTLQK
jgi:hypothetical protein